MVVLMSSEFALLSVSLNFTVLYFLYAYLLIRGSDLIGQFFAIFILLIGACESSRLTSLSYII